MGAELCSINITPLIDVMLVLFVALIVSLPLMTHAVKIELPMGTPGPTDTQPEIIDLGIEFDGTIVWNNAPVADFQQLERWLQDAANRSPQPTIRLYPERSAKYDRVAQVLAAAQRQRLTQIEFANTAQFHD
jgi:biopolymer transport protein ExbD